MANKINSQQQLDHAINSGKKVLVEFYDDFAEESPIDQAFQRLANEDLRDDAGIIYLTVDLRENPQLRQQNQVGETPLLRAYRDGHDVQESVARNPTDLYKLRDSINE